ncbi:MAG TPA: M1 family metallopeptidase [Pyrinomonadaceae bacterium]|jgi:aminopeptidase N|nr:M1 family metallopeptidase [Pyrinomonadaceae bacterium]
MNFQLNTTPQCLFRRAGFPALLLLFALCASFAHAARRERLVENWRPLHYDVTLTLDDKLSELTRAETRLDALVLRNRLNVIDLDFSGVLKIEAVSVGGRPARYEQKGERLDVFLPRPARRGERLQLRVTYHGKPADGLILTNDKDNRPAATGDNWPNRVHHWIPSLDHPSAKASVNFNVTAPARTLVVANGRLEARRTNANATQTWTYSEDSPLPPYCMVIAVAEFAELKPGAMLPNALPPVAYYVPPSEQKFALDGFGAAIPSLAFFNETVAPFPYAKLAHIVGATRFGGMENSGAIIYSRTLFDPRENAPVSPRFRVRRGLVEIVAHETAHQWFGDAVTPATWADLWLSEGFATYYAGLFVERGESPAAFREYMARKREEYLKYEQERRAPIYDRETEDLNELLNPNNYQKGAWVLHMLRAELGDAPFFRGIGAYYRAHLHKTATTEDLRAALERASGKNLRAFFARWVYASGHPRYEASWTWSEGTRATTTTAERGGVLTITLKQTQEDGDALFPNAFPVEIVTATGTRRIKLTPTGRETSQRVYLNRKPTEVRFDPDETILKEITVRPS